MLLTFCMLTCWCIRHSVCWHVVDSCMVNVGIYIYMLYLECWCLWCCIHIHVVCWMLVFMMLYVECCWHVVRWMLVYTYTCGILNVGASNVLHLECCWHVVCRMSVYTTPHPCVCFWIRITKSEPESISAGFRWTGSTPAKFREVFRAVCMCIYVGGLCGPCASSEEVWIGHNYICVHIRKDLERLQWKQRGPSMGWLRWVGSLKIYASFAKEPYKRDYIWQKRPIILRSLLIAPQRKKHGRSMYSVCQFQEVLWPYGHHASKKEEQTG